MLALAFSALLLNDPQTVVVAADAPAVVTQTSLIRIRETLSKPAGLRVTVPEPTFRVEVRAHPYFTEIPWTWDFGGGGAAPVVTRTVGQSTPPLIAIDLLPIGRALANARRAHAERAAHDEVRHALADFCSTHACD
ncbi:MAG: hypothetical protein AUI11_07240 [Acidobacteria bacterium 13_2_20CM_2_66_4]|nr:MAG: hypothetical protein AUI11_07240 [Acidobacteria bacterium 13_2_20CM_2_66_4]